MTGCQQCQKYLAEIDKFKTKINELQNELNEYYQESKDTVGRLNDAIKESSIVKQMKQQIVSANKQIAELKRDRQELMKNIDEAVEIAEYYKAKLQNIRTPKYNQQTQLLQERKRVNTKIRELYEEYHPRMTFAKKIKYQDKPTSLPANSRPVANRKG